ncbi:MAG: tetratricopeptide repeat protein [Nitrospinales bacterium]
MMISTKNIKNCAFLILLFFMTIGLTNCSTPDGLITEVAQQEEEFPEKTTPWENEAPTPQYLEIPEHRELAKRYLDHGQEMFETGNYSEAQFFLRKSLFKVPDNPTAIKLLPWAYFYEGKFNKALKAFRNARTQFDKDPEPALGMGWSYLSMQFFEKAYETFLIAEEMSFNPENAILGKSLANLYMERYDLAKSDLKKIYYPPEVDELISFWKDWKKQNPNRLMDIVPHNSSATTLFTLPTERPRYKGLLFGMVGMASPKIPGQLWSPPSFSETVFDKNRYQLAPLPTLIDHAWNNYRKGDYKNALHAFKSLKHKDVSTIDGMNGLAWSYLQTGNIARAQEIFEKALDQWPSFSGFQEGMVKVEKTLFEKAVEGQAHFNDKKYSLALESFENLKNAYPFWSHPYSMLGLIHLEQREYDQAGNRFLQALKADPDDPKAVEGMKRLHSVFVPKLIDADKALANKNYKQAAKLYWGYIDSLDGSVEMTPTLAKAYSGLGWSQIGKGHYEQAIEKFQKIKALEDYKIDSARGIGLANFYLGEFNTATKYLLKAYDLDPDQEDIYYPMYFSRMKIHSPLTAETYLLEESMLYPRRASIYLVLGWLYHSNQKPDLGVEYFLKSISLDPEIALTPEFKKLLDGERFGWQVMNHLGWAYYHRNLYDTSNTLFKWVLKSHPKSSIAMAGIGYNMFKLGKLSEAEKYLRKSLNRNPYPIPINETVESKDSIAFLEIETNARIILGRVFLLQEKYEEALALFSKENDQRPNLAQALDGMGWSYLRLNRLAEARVAFNEAIKIQPTNHLSHQGLRQVKQQIAGKNLSNPSNAPLLDFSDS